MAEVDTIDIPDVNAATKTVATASKMIKTMGLPGDTAWDGSAADATATQTAILKKMRADLVQVHTDLATTLAGYVDGLETLETAINSILGTTSGAAVITDANGTVQQYLRGLIKQWIAGTLVLGAGTNAIGKLAANAGVNIGTVTVDNSQLATAGAALSSASQPCVLATDQATLAVALDTSKVANGATGTNLTPKRDKIVASSSGATTIIAAVTGKKIRVLAYKLVANAAVNAKWQSHVTPTDLTGLSYFGAQGDGEVLPFNPVGWFETVAGEALDLNLSGAVAVGGHITYVEV